MLLSMTGYGKTDFSYNEKNFTLEIKSLNSKLCDINMRMPSIYREREIEIRKIIQSHLERGKIDCTLTLQDNSLAHVLTINEPIALAYYRQLKSLSSSIENNDATDFLSLIVKMPEVLSSPTISISDDEWNCIMLHLSKTLEAVSQYRIIEGTVLQHDISKRVLLIEHLLTEIIPLEGKRIVNLKEKFQKSLSDLSNSIKFDENRLEQEIIYYIEKLDLTEEKIRLKNHCNYFSETINENTANGKKLLFISQEMGREINTIGSKANDTDIQKIVVMMKDELEKIKEQLSNIL